METSSQYIKLCKTIEIPEAQAKSFEINDQEIGVFNIKGKFYAINNLCIHAGASLHDGVIDIENCQVTGRFSKSVTQVFWDFQ